MPSGEPQLGGQGEELGRPRIFRVQAMAEARSPPALGFHLIEDDFGGIVLAQSFFVDPLGDLQEKPLAFLDGPAVQARDGQHAGRHGVVEVGPGRSHGPGGQNGRRAGPVVHRRNEDGIQHAADFG